MSLCRSRPNRRLDRCQAPALFLASSAPSLVSPSPPPTRPHPPHPVVSAMLFEHPRSLHRYLHERVYPAHHRRFSRSRFAIYLWRVSTRRVLTTNNASSSKTSTSHVAPRSAAAERSREIRQEPVERPEPKREGRRKAKREGVHEKSSERVGFSNAQGPRTIFPRIFRSTFRHLTDLQLKFAEFNRIPLQLFSVKLLLPMWFFCRSSLFAKLFLCNFLYRLFSQKFFCVQSCDGVI